MDSSFVFSSSFSVTSKIKESFDKKGFVIIKNILSDEETAKVLDFFETSEEVKLHAYGRDDGLEKKTKVALWNFAGDDIGDMVSRSDKVVTTFEKLLGGELYHYHSKLMMKDARTGGQHVWHQDYGYWYENGCLYPDMGSVFIALDPSTKENGCLQVLAGSHKMGRLNTSLIGSGVTQRGADLERVEEVRKVCEHVFVELSPGDAVFFHSNLLHTSAQNLSSKRRWSMICAYNTGMNNPVWDHHHPKYHPLHKVANSMILECQNRISTVDKGYFHPRDDVSIREKINP